MEEYDSSVSSVGFSALLFLDNPRISPKNGCVFFKHSLVREHVVGVAGIVCRGGPREGDCGGK